jgi:phytoene dehydrogenase-like protein
MNEKTILGRAVLNPLDLSRKNTSFFEGEIMGIGNTFCQSFSFRPIPGWGHYRTPVDGLYMTGACTHPGGGISSGPGRAAAMIICEDMKIDFDTLIR